MKFNHLMYSAVVCCLLFSSKIHAQKSFLFSDHLSVKELDRLYVEPPSGKKMQAISFELGQIGQVSKNGNPILNQIQINADDLEKMTKKGKKQLSNLNLFIKKQNGERLRIALENTLILDDDIAGKKGKRITDKRSETAGLLEPIISRRETTLAILEPTMTRRKVNVKYRSIMIFKDLNGKSELLFKASK